MQLKIFVPDFKQRPQNPSIVPLLQPFFRNNFSLEELISKFGLWVTQIELVDSITECDIVVPAHYVNFYYANNLKKELFQINKLASDAYKLTICWTNGDWGITPSLNNFHLYRYSGYLSRNPGNQFCHPYFYTIDPLPRFYNSILPLHMLKPKKPVIGFCGRASNNRFSSIVDISKNLARKGLKFINLRHEDFEEYYGSSYKRFQMLSRLEKSTLVETNFIKLNKYAGGAAVAGADEDLSRIFFQNMRESHYVFCFRGWGNFSHRLYETMSAGRIPIIISSDNNIPFPDKINWNIFPIIDEKEANNIAEKVASFHSCISQEEFITLQLTAREIWESYLQYKGFMKKIVDQYLLNIIR